ncbi:hypothetical protein ABZ769_28080 [Streptomyces olivoreticuli]
MTGRPRTRLDRVRTSAGIAQLALQQIEDDLTGEDELTGEVGAQELAQILRELHHEDHRQDGVFGSLAQLFTVAEQAAARIEQAPTPRPEGRGAAPPRSLPSPAHRGVPAC